MIIAYALRILICLGILVISSVSNAQTWHIAPSSVKICPSNNTSARACAATSTLTSTTVNLTAAQNEFVPFQVAVQASASGLSAFSATMSTPLTRSGATNAIPSNEVRLYREGTVSFSKASNPEGAIGAWFDPLFPEVEEGPAITNGTWTETYQSETRNAFPYDMAANEVTVVWVDIHVPQNQPPGSYSGVLTLSGTGWATQNIPINLTVDPFTLPSTSSLSSIIRTDVSDICKAHGAYDDSPGHHECVGGNAGNQLWTREYARFFLSHRLTAEFIDSQPSTNWQSDFDGYMAAYGSLINGIDSAARLVGARSTLVLYPWLTNPSQGNALSNWASMSIAAGYFDRNMYYSKPCDEPTGNGSWTACNTDVGIAHTANISYRTGITDKLDNYITHGGGVSSGNANILIPIDQYVDGNPNFGPYLPPGGNQRESGMDAYGAFLTQSSVNQVWGYSSCTAVGGCADGTKDPGGVNWPNLEIDTTGVQNRAAPWMYFIYNVSGFYYFNMMQAGSNPSNIWNTDGLHFFGSNGDGTLVYPGTPSKIGGATHIPIASIRLDLMREGMEDYEYLKLCSAYNSATAFGIARTMFPMDGAPYNGRETGSMYNAGDYQNSQPSLPLDFANALESARHSLRACVLHSLGGPNPNRPKDVPHITLMSAPLVKPAYACTSQITVAGVQAGATLSAYINGAGPYGTATASPDFTVIALSQSLVTGQTVTVTQAVGGIISPAGETRVRTPPTSPRAPSLAYTPLYACSTASTVVGALPGSIVTIKSNGTSIGSYTAWDATSWGTTSQLSAGASIKASYSFTCPAGSLDPPPGTYTSPDSVAVVDVQATPDVVYPPQTWPVYAGQVYEQLTGLTTGASIKVVDGATTLAWTATPGPARLPTLSAAPASGDTLNITQQLCKISGITPITVNSCSALPAPEMNTPTIGDATVTFSNYVPGAQISIYATRAGVTTQIGAGGGPTITVWQNTTTRWSFASGDIVQAAQVAGSCAGTTTYSTTVP